MRTLTVRPLAVRLLPSCVTGARWTRLWLAQAAQATTKPAVMSIAGVTRSPSSSQDQKKPSTGCANCTWLARAMVVRDSPRYQAKNPKYMLTTPTYPKPNQARQETVEDSGCSDSAKNDKPKVNGKDRTSAQEITRQPPSLGVRRAPSL